MSIDKKSRLRFAHILLVAALLIIFINFAIYGFSPYFVVLIPAFPFLLLTFFPIAWKPVGYSEKHGIIGAGIGAFASILPATAISIYHMFTGWRGGADIGLGLLYVYLPLYSVAFIALGFLIGEIAALVRDGNLQRVPSILRTTSVFVGIGLCFHFLFRAYESYNVWRYYQDSYPTAAELYEVDGWPIAYFVLLAGASLLIPVVTNLVTGRNRRLASNTENKAT